jgi:hypothetical protein
LHRPGAEALPKDCQSGRIPEIGEINPLLCRQQKWLMVISSRLTGQSKFEIRASALKLSDQRQKNFNADP